MTPLTTRLCAEPYCPEIAVDAPSGWRCPAHARTGWHTRPTGSRGVYGAAWRRARDPYIRAHPTCEQPGCGRPARDVHHRNHDPTDNRETNLQSLCLEHHHRETVAASHRARQAKTSSASS